MCYTAIALVTDLDAGLEAGGGVSQQVVFDIFAANLDRLRSLLGAMVPRCPTGAGRSCSAWADGIDLTYDVP